MNLESAENTIVEETVKATIKAIIDFSKTIGLKVSDKIKINKAVKNYVENYIHRHGQVKVLGMQRPVELQSIYINVDVISPNYLNSYKSLEGLQQSFREKGNRRFHHHSAIREAGIDIVNKEQYLNVLGSPGTGKTTFLKRIGLEALLPKTEKKLDNKHLTTISQFKHDCIPVLVELNRFKNEEVDIHDIIKDGFITCDFPESDSFVDKCLEHGKLLILLDGLDEVPDDKIDLVIEHIQNFSNKYKKNRFITSCRTAFYKSYFRNFTDVEISDFDDNQIRKFIQNWFSNEYDAKYSTASQFINLLFGKKHESTLELARTPLLLTFLCLSYDSSNQLPPNRSSLYKKALSILLERWAAEKRVHNDLIYQDFHADIEIEMLASVAYEMYKGDKIFFTKDELVFSISSFIDNTLNIEKRINCSKILEAIEIHQGLLVQRASDIYSFSHLTIQEYLTAHYYYSNSKIPELVKQYFLNFKWREVFILLSGISNTNQLLVLCAKELQTFLINNIEIAEYVKWCQKIIIPSNNAEQDLVNRLFLLSIPMLYIRGASKRNPYDSSGIAELDNEVLDLIHYFSPNFKFNFYANLNKKRTIEMLESLNNLSFLNLNIQPFIEMVNNESDQTIKGLVGTRNKQNRKFLSIVLQCLSLDNSVYKPGLARFQPLLDYLEFCELIIKCKESSLTISREAWEETCRYMVVYK
jgi:hypothetical protein